MPSTVDETAIANVKNMFSSFKISTTGPNNIPSNTFATIFPPLFPSYLNNLASFSKSARCAATISSNRPRSAATSRWLTQPDAFA